MKTKTSILTLINVLFISICLSSCGEKLPTNKVIKHPYIVKSIETYDRVYCQYNLETGTNYDSFLDNTSVIDSIGKFVIGDSVIISLNKR